MSALSSVIEAAVAAAISDHPKLFADKHRERARAVLTREILKGLTREPKTEDGEPAAPEEPTPLPTELVAADDTRARAYIALRQLAGAVAPLRVGGDRISLPREADTAAVHAFADLPPRKDWLFVTGPSLAAWLEFFAEALPGIARRKITESDDMNITGARLPWLWPPSKTGKTYTPASEAADA